MSVCLPSSGNNEAISTGSLSVNESHVTRQILLTHADDVYKSTNKWPGGVVNGKWTASIKHFTR